MFFWIYVSPWPHGPTKALGGSRGRRRGRRRGVLELHGRGGVVFRVLPELQGRVGNGAVPGRLALAAAALWGFWEGERDPGMGWRMMCWSKLLCHKFNHHVPVDHDLVLTVDDFVLVWWLKSSEKYEFVRLDHHPQSGWGK